VSRAGLFVNVDGTTYLSDERTEVQEFRVNAAAILSSCGTSIAKQFQRLGGKTEEDWDANDDEDESDDEEEDETDISST